MDHIKRKICKRKIKIKMNIFFTSFIKYSNEQLKIYADHLFFYFFKIKLLKYFIL
jgi:hypothetical protein